MGDLIASMDNGLGSSSDLDWKPTIDMQFESDEKTSQFYNDYGRRVGFSVRKHSVGKNKKTGEITSKVFVCNKEGYRPKDKRDHMIRNPRAETRTGCGAQMSIRLNRHSGKFFVYQFVKTHNHLLVAQDCAHMLLSQRKISASQATEVSLAEESGIPLRSAYELMGRHVGGRESIGFTKLDQKNYLRSKRQGQLAFGEAGSVIKYFSDQALENPSFFYSMQLDNEEQITNIFWADAKMLIDYGQFGDVVSFDTTYKTNKEHRPFGVFVGLNHHREIIIFGAALMYDETADSFIWLFETFLKAMCEKAPKTIFTDQAPAICKAISCVMPNTYHRLCTWHLMQNALKHVNGVFRGPGGVSRVFSAFMDYYEEEDQFLEAWEAMLNEYNVRDNPWLQSIFKSRQTWAMAYVRHAWSAGMKTTQISESINGTIKNYLRLDHDVVQFFKHFERVLNDKRYKELEAEYDLCQKLAKVKIPVKMLKQAGNIYTKAIFEEFQEQFIASIDLFIKDVVQVGTSIVYTIATDERFCKERRVTRESNDTIFCSCRRFEMKGILCCHAIKILKDTMQINEIPDQYILKRWTKQARDEIVKDIYGREVQADPMLQQTSRYRSLCSIFTKISTRAAESQKAYDLANAQANELAKMIDQVLRLERDGNGNNAVENESPSVTCKGGTMIEGNEDTNIIKAKGLKKKVATHRGRRRTKSGLEKSFAKRKKSSNSNSVEGTGISTHGTTTDVHGHYPPQPSQSSQVSNYSHYMVGNTPHWLMMQNSDHSPNYMPNPTTWMIQQEPQHMSFQALMLQHNPPGDTFTFGDSQVSNNTAMR